jgi:hypothetical protein
MDHQLQELFDFGLEAQGFFSGGGHCVYLPLKHDLTGNGDDRGGFQAPPLQEGLGFFLLGRQGERRE